MARVIVAHSPHLVDGRFNDQSPRQPLWRLMLSGLIFVSCNSFNSVIWANVFTLFKIDARSAYLEFFMVFFFLKRPT